MCYSEFLSLDSSYQIFVLEYPTELVEYEVAGIKEFILKSEKFLATSNYIAIHTKLLRGVSKFLKLMSAISIFWPFHFNAKYEVFYCKVLPTHEIIIQKS